MLGFAEDVRSFAVGFAQDLLALLKNLPKMAAENLKKTIDDIIDQIMDVYFFVSCNFLKILRLLFDGSTREANAALCR